MSIKVEIDEKKKVVKVRVIEFDGAMALKKFAIYEIPFKRVKKKGGLNDNV